MPWKIWFNALLKKKGSKECKTIIILNIEKTFFSLFKILMINIVIIIIFFSSFYPENHNYLVQSVETL